MVGAVLPGAVLAAGTTERPAELASPGHIDNEVSAGVDGEGEMGQHGDPADGGGGVRPAVRRTSAPGSVRTCKVSSCTNTPAPEGANIFICRLYNSDEYFAGWQLLLKLAAPAVSLCSEFKCYSHWTSVEHVGLIDVRDQLNALTDDEQADDHHKDPRHRRLPPRSRHGARPQCERSFSTESMQ